MFFNPTTTKMNKKSDGSVLRNFVSHTFTLILFLLLSITAWAQPNCSANAGLGETVCSNGTLTLKGTAGTVGAASPNNKIWEMVSGPSLVSISTPTFNGMTWDSDVTGFVPGSYIFKFRAECTINGFAEDLVRFRVISIPTSYAGNNINLCTNSPVSLSANSVSAPVTGTWSAAQGSFSNVNSATSTYTPVAGTSTQLTWTTTNTLNGVYCSDQSSLTVEIIGGPTVSAGSNATLTCSGSCYVLNGSNPGLSPQSGFWSLVSATPITGTGSISSPPVFSNPNSPSSQVCNLQAGFIYTFKYDVTGPCTNGTDQMTITVEDISTAPNAGSSRNYFGACNNPPITSQTLVGGPISANETAAWTQTSGPTTAVFSPDTNVSTVTVSNLTSISSPYRFVYTKIDTITGCDASANHVVLNGGALTNFSTPSDSVLACDQTSSNFRISFDDTSSLSVSISRSITEISRPAGATSASSPVFLSSSASGGLRTDIWGTSNMIYAGVYTYQARYSNSCGVVTRNISFTVSLSALLVNAGSDIKVPCFQDTMQPSGSYAMRPATPLSSGIISWSQVSGPNTATITNGNTVGPLVYNYVPGVYTLRMTVSTGPRCSVVADDMFIIIPTTPVTTSNAGISPSGNVCAGQYKLDGNLVGSGETGVWTVTPALLSGGGFSPDANNPKATVSGLDTSETYVFSWIISNSCDSDTSSVSITTSGTYSPPIPNAGSDQCLASGSTSASLTGSSPVIPSNTSANADILWTALTTGSSVSPDTVRNATASFTGGSGEYFFEYRLSVNTCGDLSDTVRISINTSAASVDAGIDQDICGSSFPTTGTLTATTPSSIPSGATGTWYQTAGPINASIASPNSISTNVNYFLIGSYNFGFSLQVGSCPAISDSVQVNVDTPPTTSNAGPDQSICAASGTSSYTVFLNANTPTIGNGVWTIVSSPGTPVFNDVTNPKDTITGLRNGTHVFRWTITGSFACPSSSSDVTITIAGGAYAGVDGRVCDATNYDLFGSAGTTGQWTNVSGTPTPTIDSVSSYYAIAKNLSGSPTGNDYIFRYTIAAAGSCPATSDTVNLKVFQKPTQADAGTDQEVCWNEDTASLFGNAGRAGVVGTGTWFFETGPNTPTVGSNVTGSLGDTLGVSNIIPGLYMFRYELNTDSTCIASRDWVQIFREDTADAGSDRRVCDVDNINLEGNPSILNTSTWDQLRIGSSPSTAVFANANNPNTNASNLLPLSSSLYTFRWTFDSPSGCSANFDTVNLIIDEPVTGLNAGPDTTIIINSSIVLGPTGASTVAPSASTTFTWLPNFGLNSYTIEKPTFTVGNSRGTHTYTVRGTNNTCFAFDEVVITVLGPDISGKLWDDGNGLAQGTPVIDGVGIGSPNGTQLFAYLSLGGVVIDKVTLPSTGEYTFATPNNLTDYDVIISSTSVNIADFTPAPALPSTWFNVGEQYGIDNSTASPNTGIESGAPNGSIIVQAGIPTGAISLTNKGDVTLVDFGIDKIPVAATKTITSRRNPGTDSFVSALNPGTLVPLTGTDLEDGTYNATSTIRTLVVTNILNGSLEYNGIAVTNNDTIVNFDPSLLTVDPTFLGTGNVTFDYAWRDSAQLVGSAAEVTIPFTGLTVSGRLYDDGNGDVNSLVDGTPIAQPAPTDPSGSAVQMYVYLIDRTTGSPTINQIIKKATLPNSGTVGAYTFTNLNTGSNFESILSSINQSVGATPPVTTSLPTNWVNTGENYGTNNAIGTGNVSTSGTGANSLNGAILITTTHHDVPTVDFGIDNRPNTINKTVGNRLNPGGLVQVSALDPGTGFIPLTGTDREDGAYSTGTSTAKTVLITNITNGALYYDFGAGPVLVTNGDTITNFDQTKLTVDPSFLGKDTVTFEYAWKDSAGYFDLTPAVVTIPFEGVKISGTLWNDGNGDTNGAVDGTPIGNPVGTNITNTNPAGPNAAAAGTTMFVYLVDSTIGSPTLGQIVDKVQLPTSGTTGQFTFDDLNTNSDYVVFLDTVSVAIGSAPPSSSLLPNNWRITGENYGTNNTAGSDLVSSTNPAISTDGLISVSTGIVDVTDVDFGIENRPESLDKTIGSRLNPGGTTQVSALDPGTGFVPLTGTDREDGTYSTGTSTTETIQITNITNGDLYYDFGAGPVLVTNGDTIANFNQTKLTVDPTFDGADTVTFEYSWQDSAGYFDLTPAVVTIPFGLSLSGTFYRDANGLVNGANDGIATGLLSSGTAAVPTYTPLYAYLINASNIVIDKIILDPTTGNYNFENLDPNTDYTVQLSTNTSVNIGDNATGLVYDLPGTWQATGEQFGLENLNNPGVGVGIETGTPNGIIAVSTSSNNVTDVDFAGEYTAYAHDKTYRLNPDSIIGRTGFPVGSYIAWIGLYDASGTKDTTVDTSFDRPGKLSGYDQDDGRFGGATGTNNATMVLNTLPDTLTDGILQYTSGGTDYILVPNPTIADPSFIFWNPTTFRYEIPSFDPTGLKYLLKFAYQLESSFTYSYIDSAGLVGRVATYRIIYTVPLPVVVSSINCNPKPGSTTISWTTYDSREITSMDVLRSDDGTNFNKVGSVSVVNHSETAQEYSYYDKFYNEGYVFYKVKINFDNRASEYTSVCGNNLNLLLNSIDFKLYPNPTPTTIGLDVISEDDMELGIEVIDELGRVVEHSNVSIKTGSTKIMLGTQSEIPGVYFVRLSYNGHVKIMRYIKI